MTAYRRTHDHWSVVIDHGFPLHPFRFTARDACTWNYPQAVMVSAATAREAREMLAIEPGSLDWTVPASERHYTALPREAEG